MDKNYIIKKPLYKPSKKIYWWKNSIKCIYNGNKIEFKGNEDNGMNAGDNRNTNSNNKIKKNK